MKKQFAFGSIKCQNQGHSDFEDGGKNDYIRSWPQGCIQPPIVCFIS